VVSDVDSGQFFQSAKAENDRRARLGLPLDGNFEPSSRFDKPREEASDGGGGGSLLGLLIAGIAYLVFYALIAALMIGGFILKLILSAIFSKRR
jgi:hypothetical protein